MCKEGNIAQLVFRREHGRLKKRESHGDIVTWTVLNRPDPSLGLEQHLINQSDPGWFQRFNEKMDARRL